jgi:hypothetical protein
MLTNSATSHPFSEHSRRKERILAVLIFKGMNCGFLEGDISIGLNEKGENQFKAILSTSYNILPIWLRIAHDNTALAKIAVEAIADQWGEDADNQRKLLLAELTPAVQTFVACGIAYDAFYEQIKPFSGISESEVAAWRKNRTSRAAQIIEVVRRVYRLNGMELAEIKKAVSETIKWRDSAVHPSIKLRHAINRPDIPVGVDWRFCVYRYENAVNCYTNAIKIFSYLRKKTSTEESVNQGMEVIFEALEEMGLIVNGPVQQDSHS